MENYFETRNILFQRLPDDHCVNLVMSYLCPGEVFEEKDGYYFTCPQCNQLGFIMRNEINCGVFRHGHLKATGMPIPPHASEAECERLLEEGLVYDNACAKPYRIRKEDNVWKIESCGYI